MLTELLAIASGEKCEGPHRCVFCAAPASQDYKLPDSFTTRDALAVPNGHGGVPGTGGGRREWELEYYGDVLRRLESNG